MNMMQKMKEFLAAHPNSSIFSAIICSITAMSGEEMIALMGAFGVLISTVWGLIQKSISSYVSYKENRIQQAHDRQIEMMKEINSSERYRVETEAISNKIKNLITLKPEQDGI